MAFRIAAFRSRLSGEGDGEKGPELLRVPAP
jgi:hypothetical protein